MIYLNYMAGSSLEKLKFCQDLLSASSFQNIGYVDNFVYIANINKEIYIKKLQIFRNNVKKVKKVPIINCKNIEYMVVSNRNSSVCELKIDSSNLDMDWK